MNTLRLSSLSITLLCAIGATGPASAQSVAAASTSPAASHEIKSPRDCASGQATGKIAAGYDLKTAKGARTAPTTGCDAPGMAISEQGMPKPTHKGAVIGAVMPPPETEAARHTKTGHVTLLK